MIRLDAVLFVSPTERERKRSEFAFASINVVTHLRALARERKASEKRRKKAGESKSLRSLLACGRFR